MLAGLGLGLLRKDKVCTLPGAPVHLTYGGRN